MSLLTAVLLGLVQGIAEFLPISSTGHLLLLRSIFHIEKADGLFLALLRLGTLISVCVACGQELRGVTRGALGLVGIGRDRGRTTKANVNRRRMAVFVMVGTLPLLAAFALRDIVARLYQGTVSIGIMLMLGGAILYLADRFGGGERMLRDAGAAHGLLVGIGQAVGMIPGLSRCGTAMAAGLLCGFQRSFAVRFSLLLSVPALIGSIFVGVADAIQGGAGAVQVSACLLGMAASMISGFFSIRLLRWVAAQRNFHGLVYYCWGAGIVALILSLIA